MLKNELRMLLNQGYELGWKWEDKEYWLLPVWDSNDKKTKINLIKATFVIIKDGVRIFAKDYDSLEEIISDGYDLETMCDWSNPTFHD